MEEEKDILILLGERIKELRNQKGLTQVDLAARINKDQQSIQRLEAGRVNPSFLFLREVAEGLEIQLVELLNL